MHHASRPRPRIAGPSSHPVRHAATKPPAAGSSGAGGSGGAPLPRWRPKHHASQPRALQAEADLEAYLASKERGGGSPAAGVKRTRSDASRDRAPLETVNAPKAAGFEAAAGAAAAYGEIPAAVGEEEDPDDPRLVEEEEAVAAAGATARAAIGRCGSVTGSAAGSEDEGVLDADPLPLAKRLRAGSVAAPLPAGQWPPPLPPPTGRARGRAAAGSGAGGSRLQRAAGRSRSVSVELEEEDWEASGGSDDNGGADGSDADDDAGYKRVTRPSIGRRARGASHNSGGSGSLRSGSGGGDEDVGWEDEDDEPSAAAAGAAAGKRRRGKTEAQRAAADAAKRSKQEERQRLKEAKAAAALTEKLARQYQKMTDRQAGGTLYGREIVISMPPALAGSALGQAVAAMLQEKRWGMWRVEAGAQPLADAVAELAAAAAGGAGGGSGSGGGGAGGRGGGRAGVDSGCAVVTFQRRKLSPADVTGLVRGRLNGRGRAVGGLSL